MSQCSRELHKKPREAHLNRSTLRHFTSILRILSIVIAIGTIFAIGVHGHPFIAIWLGLALLGWLFLAGAATLSR
jgi:hypothetical protein